MRPWLSYPPADHLLFAIWPQEIQNNDLQSEYGSSLGFDESDAPLAAQTSENEDAERKAFCTETELFLGTRVSPRAPPIYFFAPLNFTVHWRPPGSLRS